MILVMSASRLLSMMTQDETGQVLVVQNWTEDIIYPIQKLYLSSSL